MLLYRATRQSLTPSIQPGKLAAHLSPPFALIVSKKPKDPAAPAPDLEKSLAELEKIVERLEGGELSLDESLQQFERGVALTRQCQTALRNAEQKVEILLRKSGVGSAPEEFEAAPFEDDDETP